MREVRVCRIIPFLIVLAGCREKIVEVPEDSFPAKLYPYEVTYDAADFRQRRDTLMQRIPTGSIVLVTTSSIYLRNGDVDYEFRPSSTFYYLTGFEEPSAVAIIRRRPAAPSSSELIMFVESRSGTLVQWLGPVSGPEGAVEDFGADSAYAIDAFPQWLAMCMSEGAVQGVHANLDENDDVGEVFAAVAGSNLPVTAVQPLVNELRYVKSQLEIGLIRRAVDVSVQALTEGIRMTEPSMYEYELEAILEFIVRLNGCPRLAFPSIVASGPNIVTLHYDENTRQMQAGDLVMIDFGAEYGYYAADITRTLPVSGTFTAEQAVIYDIVKSSFDAVVAAAAPGVSYSTLSSMNVETLIDGLLAKGVVTGSKSDIVSSGQYRLYIPAGLGHPVGLDVHDPWRVESSGDRVLRENVVLALEPHLYLRPDDMTVAAPYRGICARIEDDILITSTGSEILSASLPRTRGEIEALMKH